MINRIWSRCLPNLKEAAVTKGGAGSEACPQRKLLNMEALQCNFEDILGINYNDYGISTHQILSP